MVAAQDRSRRYAARTAIKPTNAAGATGASEEHPAMPINPRHLLGSAAAPCIPHPAAAAHDEPPLIREDYAIARQRFRTHLMKHGPAPDPAQPLEAPPGARQLRYRSGSLDLVAWISDSAESGAPRPGVLFLHGGN